MITKAFYMSLPSDARQRELYSGSIRSYGKKSGSSQTIEKSSSLYSRTTDMLLQIAEDSGSQELEKNEQERLELQRSESVRQHQQKKKETEWMDGKFGRSNAHVVRDKSFIKIPVHKVLANTFQASDGYIAGEDMAQRDKSTPLPKKPLWRRILHISSKST